MRCILRIAFLGILFIASTCTLVAEQDATEWISSGATKLIKPILDLRVKSIDNPAEKEVPGSTSWKMGKLLYRLSQNQSRDADEALAVLLGFYLGESNDEDLLHDVTIRGKRILPYLEKYRRGAFSVSGRQDSTKLRPNGMFERGPFDRAISAIKSGTVLNDEK